MRLDLNFVDHPKVKRLIRKAGYEAFYGLLRIFSVAGKMYTKGIFKGCTIEDIEDFADWRGEEGSFVRAIIDVGFMEEIEGNYKIHDWEIHQPWVSNAEARSKSAKKAAKARWENVQIDASNADSMRPACGEQCGTHATSNAPSPSPSPIPSPIPSPSPVPSNRESKRFCKPSLQEVEEYCKERNNGINAQKFISFYDAKGWMIGKNKMVDWKGAVRTWEQRDKADSKKSKPKMGDADYYANDKEW